LSTEPQITLSRPQRGTSKRRQPTPQFNDNTDRFMSREEASAYLGLTMSALAQDASRGQLGIPHYKFNQLVKYRRSELEAWAAERRRGGPK
jgi:hypothetical protein